MAEKRDTDRRRSEDNAVSFRPGPVLGALLDEFAERWDEGRAGAFKRLALLAAFELDSRHHDLVRELQRRIVGKVEFADACRLLRDTLQAMDAGRVQVGMPRRSANEREELIVRIVHSYPHLDLDGENYNGNDQGG